MIHIPPFLTIHWGKSYNIIIYINNIYYITWVLYPDDKTKTYMKRIKLYEDYWSIPKTMEYDVLIKINENMKYIKIFEDYVDGSIEETINDIVNNFQPKVIDYNSDPDGFTVLVKDENSDFQSWVDIWDEGGDVLVDWNQQVYRTRDRNDMIKKGVENNIDIFDEVSSMVIDHLEEKGLIVDETLQKERIVDILKKLNE